MWNDRDLHDYSSGLLLPVEHNFGMQTKKVLDVTWHTKYWTNSQFHPHMNGADGDLVGFPGLQYVCPLYDVAVWCSCRVRVCFFHQFC